MSGLHSQEIDSCISIQVASNVFNEALKHSTVLRNNLGCVKFAFEKPEIEVKSPKIYLYSMVNRTSLFGRLF